MGAFDSNGCLYRTISCVALSIHDALPDAILCRITQQSLYISHGSHNHSTSWQADCDGQHMVLTTYLQASHGGCSFSPDPMYSRNGSVSIPQLSLRPGSIEAGLRGLATAVSVVVACASAAQAARYQC
jgi:hypothetical protein